MKTTRKLGMAALMTVGVLLALEGLLRVAVPVDSLKFSWESSDPKIVMDDAGNLMMPANSEQRYLDGHRDWDVRTNAMGLREDTEIPEAKPPGSYRILALGDSWMFGWSANQEDTLPEQLEGLLSEKKGVEVEVINAGIFGTCAFDMLRRWRQLQEVFEIDAVLLGTPHNMSRQQSLMSQRGSWYASVRGAPFLEARLYLVMRRLLAPLTRPQYPWTDSENKFDSSVHDLTVLTEEATAEGLEVWFVMMPTMMREEPFIREQAVGYWVEALEPTGMKFVGHVLEQRSCWGDQDLQHASPAGYRAMAEVTAEAMAAGVSNQKMFYEPSCNDVPGYGPGKR